MSNQYESIDSTYSEKFKHRQSINILMTCYDTTCPSCDKFANPITNDGGSVAYCESCKITFKSRPYQKQVLFNK